MSCSGRGNSFYIADGYNDRIQEFNAPGSIHTHVGGPFGLHLPASINFLGGLHGWFRTPASVAIGPHGNVYTTDSADKRVLVWRP